MKKKATEKERWSLEIVAWTTLAFKQREDIGVKADYVFFFNFPARK